MQSKESNWYEPLAVLEGKGAHTAKPQRMADFHAARLVHEGQFLTPNAVSRLLWQLVSPAIDQIRTQRKVALFDNSIASGRLIQWSTSNDHRIYGVDVDDGMIGRLGQVMEENGFEGDVLACGMEMINPTEMDIGLLNPPFSLPIQSPSLAPYPSTSWGRFGPNTSAISHAYALDQALDACAVVGAVLPTTFARTLEANTHYARRLRALVHIPVKAFQESGASVATTLAIFGDGARSGSVFETRLTALELPDEIPDLDLIREVARFTRPRLRARHIATDQPVITLPVTGDNSVRVAHDGRRIVLRFDCGLIEAKVRNHLMKHRMEEEKPDNLRHPNGVVYTGEGRLDVETYLLQDNPLQEFEKTLFMIREAGGKPKVDPALQNYLLRRIAQHKRSSVGFRHTVYEPEGSITSGDYFVAVALQDQVADPASWSSPFIEAGTELAFGRLPDGLLSFDYMGKAYTLPEGEFAKRFRTEKAGCWRLLREGRSHAFPQVAAKYRAEAVALGIPNWLTWEFQLDDLIELAASPTGAVVGWSMGLGKTYLSASLALLGGHKHNVISVEAYLVEEMVMQFKNLPIPRDWWQVIEKPEDLRDLRRINIIAYSKLRSPVDSARPKFTYAKALRRRVGTLIADEGHLLRNPDTQQSRALWTISAKRKYILSGTPAANYPRDIHALLCFVSGDATASQPYGWHKLFLSKEGINSLAYAQRGIDAFRDAFITYEWVTNQFAENNREGAKREVPKVANLASYRDLLSRHVKRRIQHEPEVSKHVRIPIPDKFNLTTGWDEEHLSLYLAVCEEFAADYSRMVTAAGGKPNLVVLLARIGAVFQAANYPQAGIKHMSRLRRFTGLTSKQRFALDRLKTLTEEGNKSILYATSPALLELFKRELEKDGIQSVTMHGGKTIKARTAELNREFRFGSAPVLLASLGVTQAGLNIPQANRVLFYNRDWSAKTEAQALARVLRPQQQRDVVAEFLHLPGSVDEYQAQMVDFKASAFHAGLDWAEPISDDIDFLHLDTIFGQFVADLAEFKGLESHEMKSLLKAA